MLAEKLLALAKPSDGSLHIPRGCVFQILSVVSPVEGQERRICHYQLGSAKQLGWAAGSCEIAVEAETDSELQGCENVQLGGQPDPLTSDSAVGQVWGGGVSCRGGVGEKPV